MGAYGDWGERVPLAPTQDNGADLAQAFIDLSVPIADGRFTLRAGRQELSFGSLRMVGTREGPKRAFASASTTQPSGGIAKRTLSICRPA